MTNQCTSDADKLLLEDDTIGDLVKACGLGCVANDDVATCSEECITTDTDLSAGCSGCFAAVLVCSFEKCADECSATLGGEDCDDCQWDAGCIASFTTCSGLTGPSVDPEADCEAQGGTWNAEDQSCTVTSSNCVPECDDSQVCNNGACEPASPPSCEPPCADNENCEDGTCVLDPTMVGSVPTSCGSPGQGLEPVDCTKNGDTNAQCVFSNHCMCTVADGFECETSGEVVSAECVPGSSCVSATPPGNKPLSEIFETIFQNQGCTAGYCHGGGANELLLSDVANTHANLVGQTATTAGCGLTERVVPGNPEESILWHRVKPLAEGETADTACISKMPAGSDGLSEEHAQLVYDWIKGGALQ